MSALVPLELKTTRAGFRALKPLVEFLMTSSPLLRKLVNSGYDAAELGVFDVKFWDSVSEYALILQALLGASFIF